MLLSGGSNDGHGSYCPLSIVSISKHEESPPSFVTMIRGHYRLCDGMKLP